MPESIAPAKVPAHGALKERPIDRVSRRIFLALLSKIRKGRLLLVDNGRRHVFGERHLTGGLSAEIRVRHPRFYSRAILGGSIGAGEAFMAGWWSTDDLTALIRIVIQNQQVFEEVDKGLSRVMAPLHRVYHILNQNTRTGSRRNIGAHYDLSNDFYALFLDGTMTYSCGLFEKNDSTLGEASVAKYDRICRKLGLAAGDKVIEIGTGWGGFAVHAVLHYGVHVTTTTISDRQYEFAKQRFRSAGIADRVRLLKKDYRDLQGRYDKLVSIEMIEAVGHQYLATFFNRCGRLLEKDGLMALQAITISDQAFEQHKHSADFIKRYIFPGSCIPSVAAIGNAIARGTDLRLVHLEDITRHYPRTLREWRRRFFSRIEAVRNMGFSEAFIRMWEFYLCYCEAGFTERYIGDVQVLFAKPMRRENIYPNILPPAREDGRQNI
ncbi:MAG: cyclopropane-fatty-acyl-phospholipid synthase family protein [Desulfobacterales bacterium]